MDESRSMLAPDLMASCCLYMLLSINEYYIMIALWLIVDLAYYGALALAMPLALLIYFKCIKHH